MWFWLFGYVYNFWIKCGLYVIYIFVWRVGMYLLVNINNLLVLLGKLVLDNFIMKID